MPENTQVPKILERKDVILLSADIECPCGRLKDRPHCPACGRTKLYGKADTEPARSPNGDVINNCKTYRCLGCAEQFNDVDWYFNCHAPIKIDWIATRAAQKAKLKEEWLRRVLSPEQFDWNTRQKCRAEVGFDPLEQRDLLQRASLQQVQFSKVSPKDRLLRQIAEREQELKEDPTNQDAIDALKYLKDKLLKLESENDQTNPDNGQA